VLFEIGGVEPILAKEAMRLAAYKLPIRTKYVSREVEADAVEGNAATV